MSSLLDIAGSKVNTYYPVPNFVLGRICLAIEIIGDVSHIHIKK